MARRGSKMTMIRHKRMNSRNKTSRSRTKNFEREITVKFFETLLMIKLFHWKTKSYAAHKASDELYGSLNDHMDKFIEVLLGKANNRMDLSSQLSIPLLDLNSTEQMREKIQDFKSYLVSLSNHPGLKSMTNTDLFNIRDEILGDMNQFLYLLSFK